MRNYDSRHTVSVLRKMIGLSQGDLATLVGCSKRTLQAIEIGRLKLSENLAAKIAHETGVGMNWLLGGDYHASPKIAFTDAPYTKRVYEDTRAAITTGRNPNPVAIILSQEGLGALNIAPIPMMVKQVEQLSSLLHPQMDYWLASILSSVFAAAEVGQARLAIYRLAEFCKAMRKEFGQRFDGDFSNDATVVFEQALQRIKMTELLVEQDKSSSTHPPKSPAGKQEPAHKDLLADMQLAELKEIDTEALWASLNDVGERLKTRHLCTQKLYQAFDDQLVAVFRAAKVHNHKSNPSVDSEPPAKAVASEKPNRKSTKG